MPSFLKKLFGQLETKKIQLEELGQFSYANDGKSEYWETEQPVSNLPDRFEFGAVSGTLEGPDIQALAAFRAFARNPEVLYSYLNDLFFSTLSEQFGELTINDIKKQFYLKSLSCTSEEDFEFGLHAKHRDIFVELFCRGGEVTEVHIDEGCCV